MPMQEPNATVESKSVKNGTKYVSNCSKSAVSSNGDVLSQALSTYRPYRSKIERTEGFASQQRDGVPNKKSIVVNHLK